MSEFENTDFHYLLEKISKSTGIPKKFFLADIHDSEAVFDFETVQIKVNDDRKKTCLEIEYENRVRHICS